MLGQTGKVCVSLQFVSLDMLFGLLGRTR